MTFVFPNSDPAPALLCQNNQPLNESWWEREGAQKTIPSSAYFPSPSFRQDTDNPPINTSLKNLGSGTGNIEGKGKFTFLFQAEAVVWCLLAQKQLGWWLQQWLPHEVLRTEWKHCPLSSAVALWAVRWLSRLLKDSVTCNQLFNRHYVTRVRLYQNLLVITD